MKKHLVVAAAASFCVTAWAGNPPSDSTTTPHDVPVSKTAAAVENDATTLEQKLKAAQNRADYAKVLQGNGYRISATNDDEPNYLEYEVVKGNESFEVQLGFDDGASKATKIDVASNIWRADSTEKMLKDPQYKNPTAMVVDPDARYSDRHHMKAWTDEKDQLEKVLTPKQTLDAYKQTLKQRGYEITSVNDRKADYVEYEIVKGDNSYEVQIDLDPKSKLATEVDVTSNLWDADETDRAKDANEATQAVR